MGGQHSLGTCAPHKHWRGTVQEPKPFFIVKTHSYSSATKIRAVIILLCQLEASYWSLSLSSATCPPPTGKTTFSLCHTHLGFAFSFSLAPCFHPLVFLPNIQSQSLLERPSSLKDLQVWSQQNKQQWRPRRTSSGARTSLLEIAWGSVTKRWSKHQSTLSLTRGQKKAGRYKWSKTGHCKQRYLPDPCGLIINTETNWGTPK